MNIDRDFYKTLLDGLYEGVYFLDRSRVIRYWNRSAERITGYFADEVLGKRCSDNVLMHVDESGRALCGSASCPAVAAMTDRRAHEVEVYLHHKDGHRLPALTRVAPIRDSKGEIIGAVEVFTDNRKLHEAQQRVENLERLALMDQLTEIGNRRYGEVYLQSSLNRLARYGWPFGLLFADIDDFKKVNDAYGHEVGDMVLKTVAKTLIHNVRASDCVSRWGGEEFVILILHADIGHIERCGEKLLALIRHCSVTLDSSIVQVTVSMGGTCARADDTIETILARADELMYRSKQGGKDRLTLAP
ncbi:MAG: sensor domain-containing diguanylate cyclase [Deltaproteobacteria bacterium]|nr:sensor domain-containing diguanylate cyclase [Deltaproteobacteria bacterium]